MENAEGINAVLIYCEPLAGFTEAVNAFFSSPFGLFSLRAFKSVFILKKSALTLIHHRVKLFSDPFSHWAVWPLRLISLTMAQIHSGLQ